MDHWFGQASIVETLLFREHYRVALLEVDVFPPESLASLVAPISKYLRTSHARVRQQVDQCAIAAGFDCGFSLLTDVVDRGTGLFVDEGSELLAILGRSSLPAPLLCLPSSGMAQWR